MLNAQAWCFSLGVLTANWCDDPSTTAPTPSSSIMLADPVKVPVDPSAPPAIDSARQAPSSTVAPARPRDSSCRCPANDALCTCL